MKPASPPSHPRAPLGTRKSLVSDARQILATCPAQAARQAARRLTRYFDARLAIVNLTMAQFGLMAEIAAARDDGIGALAERLDLDPSTLSRNLRGLEKAGLVEIAAIEPDLRRRAIWLTEEGARRLEAAIPLWRKGEGALNRRIGADAKARLRSIADRLAATE